MRLPERTWVQEGFNQSRLYHMQADVAFRRGRAALTRAVPRQGGHCRLLLLRRYLGRLHPQPAHHEDISGEE